MQSSGKSLFSLNLCLWLGKYYNYPFVIERDIYANPWDLEKELKEGDRRRTYLYDEQPERLVGMGSAALKVSLSDWEDIARYTQKNVIYCSPSVRDHSHYFIFEQVDYDIKRISNKVCLDCSDYAKCQTDFYHTLCEKGVHDKGINFWSRDGYPVSFSFMLKTHRMSDKQVVPRGVVTFPMVEPKTALRYDAMKKKNLENFEKLINNAWNLKIKEIEKFMNEHFSDLVVEGKHGLQPASKKVIESYFYEAFPPGKMTVDECGTLIARLTAELKKKCAEAAAD
jgi:hypothetical protein